MGWKQDTATPGVLKAGLVLHEIFLEQQYPVTMNAPTYDGQTDTLGET